MSSIMGEKIRSLRKRLQMTQSELAGNDFTKSFISQIEKGQTRPSLRSLQIIAQRLGRPVSYFLSDEAEATSTRPPNLDHQLSLARNHLSNNRTQESLNAFRKALPYCMPNDYATIGEIHATLGRIEFKHGNYPSASEEFEAAVNALENSHLPEAYIKCLNDLASTYYQMKDYKRACQTLQDASESCDRFGVENPQLRLMIECNFGNTLSRLGDYPKAVKVLESALTTSKSSGEYYLFGKLNQILGYCYDEMGMLSEAVQTTTRAMSFYKLVENKQLQIHSQLNLASHLRKLGEISQAKGLINEVLGTSEISELRFERAHAHAELALLLLDDGNATGALGEVATALRISPSHENLPQWAETVVRCAGQADIDPEIIAQFEQAAQEWNHNTKGLAELHSHLGDLYTKLNDPNRANHHFSQSVSLYRSLRNP